MGSMTMDHPNFYPHRLDALHIVAITPIFPFQKISRDLLESEELEEVGEEMREEL